MLALKEYVPLGFIHVDIHDGQGPRPIPVWAETTNGYFIVGRKSEELHTVRKTKFPMVPAKLPEQP